MDRSSGICFLSARQLEFLMLLRWRGFSPVFIPSECGRVDMQRVAADVDSAMVLHASSSLSGEGET